MVKAKIKKESLPKNNTPAKTAGPGHNRSQSEFLKNTMQEYLAMDEQKAQIAQKQKGLTAAIKQQGYSVQAFRDAAKLLKMDVEERAHFLENRVIMQDGLGMQRALPFDEAPAAQEKGAKGSEASDEGEDTEAGSPAFLASGKAAVAH